MQELLTTAHSFPSGHTLLTAAFAFVVVAFYKDFRAWLAFGLVIAVGLARVYQGLHWPSDIIGSVIMGAAAAIIAGYLCKIPIIRQLIERPPAARRLQAVKHNGMKLVPPDPDKQLSKTQR